MTLENSDPAEQLHIKEIIGLHKLRLQLSKTKAGSPEEKVLKNRIEIKQLILTNMERKKGI